MPTKRKRSFRDQKDRKPHPRNKYSESAPDFDGLAALYPSFKPFVFHNSNGRPNIDWTDYNATRELTRILLLHDFGINWWIPDGQLCPTVPNRCNYIHWIEELLASDVVASPGNGQCDAPKKGLDVGTGANCIYPLLGAALHGWNFVATDVTAVALEWAQKNLDTNPCLKSLIEIRQAGIWEEEAMRENEQSLVSANNLTEGKCPDESDSCVKTLPEESFQLCTSDEPNESFEKSTLVQGSKASRDENEMVHYSENSTEPSDVCLETYTGPPILLGVIKECEQFDFCMCNPPFFSSIRHAGANPKTSCGGTMKEMVCPGGEKAFIKRMIDDSIQIKQHIRWYTTMVGRKVNLKFLSSYLRKVGARVVQTTEFVQGRTSRWGLAWSFVSSPMINFGIPYAKAKRDLSFMIEGLHRNCSALNVLQFVEQFFLSHGASCQVDLSLFAATVTFSSMLFEKSTITLEGNDKTNCLDKTLFETFRDLLNTESCPRTLSLRVSIFQQSPGSLLIKGSLTKKEKGNSDALSFLFVCLENHLRNKIGMTLQIHEK